MKALVYTDVEELTYREEKNPIEKNGLCQECYFQQKIQSAQQEHQK